MTTYDFKTTIMGVTIYWPKMNSILRRPEDFPAQVSWCTTLIMWAVVRDFSSGPLSNKYWAVRVETFRPVMSQINHPTPSTVWGSAEISWAEKAQRKGIEPESMETQELTHQPLHDYRHYKKLARMRAWHYVASSEHSYRCSFSPFLFSVSLSAFAHRCLRQNKSYTYISRRHACCLFSLPLLSFSSLSISMPFSWCIFLLSLSYVCSHRDLFCFARVLQQ